jgi:hypothetical protein
VGSGNEGVGECARERCDRAPQFIGSLGKPSPNRRFLLSFGKSKSAGPAQAMRPALLLVDDGIEIVDGEFDQRRCRVTFPLRILDCVREVGKLSDRLPRQTSYAPRTGLFPTDPKPQAHRTYSSSIGRLLHVRQCVLLWTAENSNHMAAP